MSNRTNYDAELAALNTALAEMGQAVAQAVDAVAQAMGAADQAAAARIAQGDGRINSMERGIEHRCMTLLLCQQPVAGDLRRVSAALKVVTDLERIGDHAADIADIVPKLCSARRAGDPALNSAVSMAHDAYRMTVDALDAFLRQDEVAARAVIAADDAVDYAFDSIKRMLAAEIAAGPGAVDAALDLLMVIKYLERVGDHAVNVAEWVQFVRTGHYKGESLF